MANNAHNPFQAPAPDAGPGPAKGRMPPALRRDLLSREAATKAIGLLYLPFAASYLVAICWSMFQKHPLAPWELLADPPLGLGIVYATAMLLGGVGVYFLQLWGRLLFFATFVLPLLTWLSVPSDFLWNAVSFEMRTPVRLAWLLTPVLCLVTLWVLGSPDSGIVSTRSYRLIIRQTPQVGPAPVVQYLVAFLLVLLLTVIVIELRN